MLASATPPLPGSQLPPASPFPLLLLAVLSGPASGRVPRSVPRTSLPISEADSYLTRFSVPQTYNYSVLLVDPASHTLYVGTRDTVFALSLPFSGERPRRIDWMVPEAHRQNCRKKGKKELEGLAFATTDDTMKTLNIQTETVVEWPCPPSDPN
uniref:Sema domain-containing protein n=1 Tax=Canis lupus dingo TaxID=286419 RepID=A0A8C0R111_CANLU